MDPAVTIIIPTYSGQRTIRQAIDSVLDQADVPGGFELIVVDDASSDGTQEIVRRYGTAVTLLVQSSNSGVSVAVNRGVELARGRYISFLHDDDYFLAGKLRAAVLALDQNQDAILAFSDYMVIDSETGQPIESIAFGHSPDLDEMLMNWGVVGPPSTVTVRRRYFDAMGGFDSRLRWAEDLDFMLRARRAGCFVHLPVILTMYRKRTSIGASESRYPANQILAFEAVMREHFGERAESLIAHARDQRAAILLGLASRQLDQMRQAEAMRTFLELIRYRPSYLWRQVGIGRYLQPSNLLRLLRAILPSRVLKA